MKLFSKEFFIRNNFIATGYKDYTLGITEGYFDNVLQYQIYLLDDLNNIILFKSIAYISVNNAINEFLVFIRKNNETKRLNEVYRDAYRQLERDNAESFFVRQGTRIASVSHYKIFRKETVSDYE